MNAVSVSHPPLMSSAAIPKVNSAAIHFPRCPHSLSVAHNAKESDVFP